MFRLSQRRRRHPSQHVHHGELPDQLTVSRQHEAEAVNDLLGHEVVTDIPTNLAVKCFGHDIANPQVHAAFNPKEPVLRSCRRFLAASTRLRRVWHDVRAFVRSRGYGGINARGLDADWTHYTSTILWALLRCPLVYSSRRIFPRSNKRRIAAS